MKPAYPLAEAAAEPRVVRDPARSPGIRAEIALEAVLLAAAAIFFLLHFVHLKADFPNYSPWMDWAKYTDEGWYGDAAIRHYQLGHWNVPGDFNPAAALPVWPTVELVLFRFTGVSLVAARALTVSVFGLILVCCYWLIRRWSSGSLLTTASSPRRSLAPSIAVLLLSVNPFCYVFSRLAILEPLLILLMLAALLVASAGAATAPAFGGAVGKSLPLRFAPRAIALGLLLPSMVLTKTTGVFLFPAIFWLLWASKTYRVKPFVRSAALACAVGIAAWGGYYLLFIRPRYLIDYRYLYSANGYTGITLATFVPILYKTVLGCMWMGGAFFVLALIAVIGSLVRLGSARLRGNPLPVALLLWIFGYAAFLTYHANLQPRYYFVLAIPLTMLVAIFLEPLLARALATSPRDTVRAAGTSAAWTDSFLLRLPAGLLGAALMVAVVNGARGTISLVRHPEYTFVSAAEQIRVAVRRELAVHPSHSPLLLSISGSDLSLMTGLPSICDDFGTLELAQRVALYRPGWFVAWNYVEDDKMEALAPWFRVVRVATIPAFDDPDRNLLILYRLDPLSSPGVRGRSGRRRSLPRRFRTKVGEQPSAVQLKH